jgi:hypothetical protein
LADVALAKRLIFMVDPWHRDCLAAPTMILSRSSAALGALAAALGCGAGVSLSPADGGADDGRAATTDTPTGDGRASDAGGRADGGSANDSGSPEPSDGSGTKEFEATFPSPDAAVPSIDAGVMTAVQENGGPSPSIIILVGCPSNGLVEVAPYAVTESLGVTTYGPFLGALSIVGPQVSITVPGPDAGRLIDIAYNTSNPIAGQVAPFAYPASVAIDPALLSASRPFRAETLNPQYPGTTLGYWNTDVLVTCP